MGTSGRNKDRTPISLPDTTVAKLKEFRDREYRYVPAENRANNIAWNTVILRLLAIEEETRPAPKRAPEPRQPRQA